jgi:5,10-methenyltetrahydrofolate synthetase
VFQFPFQLMDVAAWRREMRARLIDARLGISAEEHERSSRAIVNRVDGILGPIPPQTISAYWPFKGEVDLRPLMGRLQAMGWITSLPSVVRRRSPLEFLEWRDGMEMDLGPYDIPVPRNRKVVRPDVVIAPLVAFDRNNYRLGYGSGFFDITLAALQPPPLTIGVGFEISGVETIHPLPTDIPLNLIVTEAGVWKPGRLE